MLKYVLPFALSMASVAHASYFYVGGSVGISALETKQNHQILNATGTTLKNEKHDLGNLGFIGGGFIGYNFDLPQCFDLGMEIFANGFTTESDSSHKTSSTVSVPSKLKISQNYNCGVRVLPGYQFFDQIEVHLIAGYTLGGFKLKDNGVYGIISKHFNKSGFQVGAGTMFGFCNHLSLRLDVIYSGYPKHLNATGAAPSVAQGGPTGGTTTSYQLKNSAVDSTLALVYRF